EPTLEAVDVTVGARLAAPSVDDRKVVVHPVRSRPRLIYDHRREREDRHHQSRGEAEVDDRDGDPPRNTEPVDRLHERIEQQRDQRGDEKEKENVTDRSRHEPHEQQQHRQPDELNPARNLDLRRAAGHRHRGHRTARAVRSSEHYDWSQDVNGSLALEPQPWWADSRLKAEPTYVTVAEMPPPSPPGRSARHRPRPRRRPARHGRWKALLLVGALAAFVVVLLGAF